MNLTTFDGGIHPPVYKAATRDLPLERMPAPPRVILPLTQHVGKQAVPLVKKGDAVLRGMVVANIEGAVSAPIHSPVCGTVMAIARHSSSGGFPLEAIHITSAEDAFKSQMLPPLDKDTIAPEAIRDRVRLAGIVGQGGAAFPTWVKLNAPRDRQVDMILLNGCECEPYLTRDYRFMIERPEAVISGLKLIMQATGVQKALIGIEDHSSEAIQALRRAAQGEPSIAVLPLKTKYPQGAEKMLIKAMTGRVVPPGKLPFDVGVIVHNIVTAVAVYDAVVKGEPQITAALTVSGHGVRRPKNLIAPVGTPIIDILEYCGGVSEDAARVVVGGPMMGVAQYDLAAPILKATSGIIVLTHAELENSRETACLRCGQCVEACPLKLLPTRLARLSQLGRYAEAEEGGVTVCMECGTCAFTCPANIPLVQWLRLAKRQVLQKRISSVKSILER